MKTFRVKITTTWTGFINVEATDKDQAESLAWAKYENEPDSVSGDVTEFAFDAIPISE